MADKKTYYHVVKFTHAKPIAIKSLVDSYFKCDYYDENTLVVEIRGMIHSLRNFKLLHNVIYFTTRGGCAFDIVIKLCKEMEFQLGIETDARTIVACDNGEFYRHTITTCTDIERIRPIRPVCEKDEKLRLNIIYSFRKMLVSERNLINRENFK